MTEPESPQFEVTTAWHPMLVALLEHYLPSGWQLLPEFQLSRQPLRVDIVILRRTAEPAGTPRKLHSILDHLRPHTLIEHKGPTDDLEPEDALVLLGYAAQYMRLAKVKDPSELCLMFVADRIPDGLVEQIERHGGTFAALGGGLWHGALAGFALHGVATGTACEGNASERLFYAFSRAYLKRPEKILPLEAEEWSVYHELYLQVEQFRRQRGAMAMKDYEAAKATHDEAWDQLMREFTPALMRKLTPEERLEGLTPTQRLAGLTPDEILSALPPETREMLAKKLPH
jgi:hypothetical protein